MSEAITVLASRRPPGFEEDMKEMTQGGYWMGLKKHGIKRGCKVIGCYDTFPLEIIQHLQNIRFKIEDISISTKQVDSHSKTKVLNTP